MELTVQSKSPGLCARRGLFVNLLLHHFQSSLNETDVDQQNDPCNPPANIFVKRLLPYRSMTGGPRVMDGDAGDSIGR